METKSSGKKTKEFIFSKNQILDTVQELTPRYLTIRIPSEKKFETCQTTIGSFVVIEGRQMHFLGRISELKSLPDGKGSGSCVSANIEIMAHFDAKCPHILFQAASSFPYLGAKVYACTDDQTEMFLASFGKKKRDENAPLAKIGKLAYGNSDVSVSLSALLSRHCGILGTTGGGKSWTLARLIEAVGKNSSNKGILIDATGEYRNLKGKVQSIQIGTGEHVFNYRDLTIDELIFLLHPAARTQAPKLMEAIRSLKMSRIDTGNALSDYYTKDENGHIINGNVIKAEKDKRKFEAFYSENAAKIEDNVCNFDVRFLAKQVANECVLETGRGKSSCWGEHSEADVSDCISLIARINNIVSKEEYNKAFGFRPSQSQNSVTTIKEAIKEFLESDNKLLRLDFSKVGFDYQVREILVNAIGTHLLNEARKNRFKQSPVIVFIDEAHQFLNKCTVEDKFISKSLDSFEMISKEGRKYGLFLCITTQTPGDIPEGTLGQMGTFILHRMTNDKDIQAISNAVSSSGTSNLSLIPVLGEGEAMLLGIDFPMPLIIKVDAPEDKPESQTPLLQSEYEQCSLKKSTKR